MESHKDALSLSTFKLLGNLIKDSSDTLKKKCSCSEFEALASSKQRLGF